MLGLLLVNKAYCIYSQRLRMVDYVPIFIISGYGLSVIFMLWAECFADINYDEMMFQLNNPFCVFTAKPTLTLILTEPLTRPMYAHNWRSISRIYSNN